LCVNDISVLGTKGCRVIVAEESDRTHPLLLVDVCISVSDSRSRGIDAILAAPLSTPGKIDLLATLSKLTSTVDEETIKGVINFVCDRGETCYATSTLTQRPYDSLRILASACNISKDFRKVHLKLRQTVDLNLSISLHGFQMVVPIGFCESCAMHRSSKWSSQGQQISYLCFSFGWTEFRSGHFLRLGASFQHWIDDDFHECNQINQSYHKNATSLSPTTDDVPDDPLRGSLNVSDLMSYFPEALFRHFVSRHRAS